MRKFIQKFLREYKYISDKIFGEIYQNMEIAVETNCKPKPSITDFIKLDNK